MENDDFRPFAQAFASQYSAIMLIVLTFLIGTTSGRSIPTPLSRKVSVLKKEEAVWKAKFSSFEELVSSGKMSAVASILRSHDLRLVVVASLPKNSSPKMLQTAQSTLEKQLTSLGILPSAVDLWMKPEAPNAITLFLLREAV